MIHVLKTQEKSLVDVPNGIKPHQSVQGQK